MSSLLPYYHDLPEALRPPEDGSRGIRKYDEILNHHPIEKLPRSLMPNRHRSYLPPLVHLGYVLDMEKIMLYAEEHGLVVSYRMLDFELSRQGVYESKYTLNMHARDTIVAVFRHVENSFGITPERLQYVLIFPVMKDQHFVSITTNRTLLYDPPPASDLEGIRRFLNPDGTNPSKWYLDAAEWFWAPRHGQFSQRDAVTTE